MAKARKDSPIFRMVVEPGALVPADAYTQERLDTYRINSVVNVKMTQDINPPLLNKYWSILSLAVKQCRTPWRTSNEASDALKRAFGVVVKAHTAAGTEYDEVGSLTDLEGPELEDFFEGAMLLLYKITGVDPETLWKETPDPAIDSPPTTASVSGSPDAADAMIDDSAAGAVGEGGDGGFGLESLAAVAADEVGDGGASQPPPDTSPLSSADPALMEVSPFAADPPREGSVTLVEDTIAGPSDVGFGDTHGTPRPRPGEADERAMVNDVQPMNTRELKQEAIKKVLDLALDGDLTMQERTETLAKNRDLWVVKMPGHPQFIRTVFETAAKVMRNELPRPAATKYLFSLKDG